MTLDQLLRHVAHLVTAHGRYSMARDAMTIPVPCVEAMFERRIKALPGAPPFPFVVVLEEGRRRKFWKLDVDPTNSTLVLVVHWAEPPRESFARQMDWFSRMEQRMIKQHYADMMARDTLRHATHRNAHQAELDDSQSPTSD